ncbi:nuclear transcription factor Y subunit gamma isoform X2 [Hyposmocoma kahamanoa]|uniref:nuclear transcription factor Y subunit gamma isoform X2 n=1 Tax=Hyposmocoma kahamanoa TaxID=1477025 RepID=UPI000E6DA325|nr:nuclear transcription factor Y subunit gamma isoform X2 [Hyposmocoma kahamanoa]
MSVCFFVPAADQSGNVAEEVLDQEAVEEVNPADTAQQTLQQFWHNVMEDIKKVTSEDFKTQALPLARIKKIMKLDEEVKMISAEAPILFAKAAEIFIHELTLRAWSHTEDNKRRTLQRNDIAMAISKSDQFDFLIDIVPRHEVKPTKPRDDPPRPMQTVEQLPQQHQTLQQAHQQFIIQPTQIVQQSTNAQAATTSSNVAVSQQPVIVQQLVTTSNGEVQQQLQLTQAQLNMIRLQLQNNQQGSPVVIHTQQQSPQIIQVTSQAQHQPQQQVFIAQVASQEES